MTCLLGTRLAPEAGLAGVDQDRHSGDAWLDEDGYVEEKEKTSLVGSAALEVDTRSRHGRCRAAPLSIPPISPVRVGQSTCPRKQRRAGTARGAPEAPRPASPRASSSTAHRAQSPSVPLPRPRHPPGLPPKTNCRGCRGYKLWPGSPSRRTRRATGVTPRLLLLDRSPSTSSRPVFFARPKPQTKPKARPCIQTVTSHSREGRPPRVGPGGGRWRCSPRRRRGIWTGRSRC